MLVYQRVYTSIPCFANLYPDQFHSPIDYNLQTLAFWTQKRPGPNPNHTQKNSIPSNDSKHHGHLLGKIPTFYWDKWKTMTGNPNVFNPNFFLATSGEIPCMNEPINYLRLGNSSRNLKLAPHWSGKMKHPDRSKQLSSPLDFESSSLIVMIPMFSHIQVNLYA